MTAQSALKEKPKVQKSKLPNVVFIYADDMGKGMLSSYGQKYVETPNIDMLVRRGVAFESAYACMLSAPSRASLLTGYSDCNQRDRWKISQGGKFLTADTSVISSRENKVDLGDVRLGDGDYYLPQVFKRAGYVTAEIGKLEWGFTATRKQMTSHGWDYYYGYLDHVRCHGYYPPFLFDNGKIDLIEGNTHINCSKEKESGSEQAYKERWNMDGKKHYSQDIFLTKILQFISDHKDEPFFLYHPTQLPHGPISVPKVYPEIAALSSLTDQEKEYASMVKLLDENVGRIIEHLRDCGILDNTLIVFASDNGHEIYYAQPDRCSKPYVNRKTGKRFDDYTDKYYSEEEGDVFNGNASMAGLKRSNLDGGSHVPLVFYYEGVWDKGCTTHQLVSIYDLLPTFADMLGVDLPVKKDGVSFLKVLKGKKLPAERCVFNSSFIGPSVVRNDGWKLRYYSPAKVYELYNLTSDPQEKLNVLDSEPKVANELKRLLLEKCGGKIENGLYRE